MDEQDANDAAMEQLMNERLMACVEALKAAQTAGTPEGALLILAHECGAATHFYKELRK